MAEKHKGPYLAKEDIDFWYPVSNKLGEKITSFRDVMKYKAGLGEGDFPLAPYQLIEVAVEEYIKARS